MASLGSQVIQGAQEQAQQGNQTIGNAVQAYQVASTAEHARQELDMEKQNASLKKSQFILEGVSRANSMTGNMQKEYLSQFTDQVQKMDPTIDTQGFKALVRSPDDIQKILAGVKQMQDTGGVQNPEQASYVTGMFGFDGAAKFISDSENHKAMVAAAQMKGDAIQNPRLQMLGWNKHKAAVSGVVDDKPTNNLLAGYQSINNALVNYQNSGGMPGELAQLQTMLRLNAGSGGTGVAERAEGYATDLGLSKAKVMQILTGNIQNTELSSPGIVKAIMEISQGELKNKQKQAAQQISKKASAYQGVYQNDQYASVNKPDFDNAVRQQYGQFDLDETGKPTGSTGGGSTAQADAIKQQWLQTPAGKDWTAKNSKQAGQ